MFSTRTLIILSLCWGSAAFAQSTTVLDYSGRLFAPGGGVYVGAISVRADVRVGSCVLYRRLQMEGAADQVVTDVDGQFQIRLQTGADPVGPDEFESADLQTILSTTRVTPVSCLDGSFFTPNSNVQRVIEIAVSMDHGTTWEVVDGEDLRPAPQSFDTMMFAGFPLANFVYDNGDGSVTRAKVETLVASPYSGVLAAMATDGTFGASAIEVDNVGGGASAVVNRGYSDAHLGGADASALQGLGMGAANQVIFWDGSKWTLGPLPDDAAAAAGNSGDVQIHVNGTLGVSSVVPVNVNGSGLGVGMAAVSALSVSGASVPLVVNDSGGGGRQIELRDTGVTRSVLGGSVTYPFEVFVGASSVFRSRSSGDVSVGAEGTPATTARLSVLTTDIAASGTESAGLFTAAPPFIANSSQSTAALRATANPSVNSGVTASGPVTGVDASAIITSSTSAGTANSLVGLSSMVGVIAGNTNVADAYGLDVIPRSVSGTIDRFFGVSVRAPDFPVRITEEYAFYQDSTTAKNVFVGPVIMGTTTVANPHVLSLSAADSVTPTSNRALALYAGTNARFDIGTSTNGGADPLVSLDARSGYGLSLKSDSVEAMRVKGGQVSIGTTTMGAALHVNGPSGSTLRIVDGNQGAGKVLTSNSTGQASWQDPSVVAPLSLSSTFNGTGSAFTSDASLSYVSTASGGGMGSGARGSVSFTGIGGPQILSGIYGGLTISPGAAATSQYTGAGFFQATVNASATATEVSGLSTLTTASGTVDRAYGAKIVFGGGGALTSEAYGIHIGTLYGAVKRAIVTVDPEARVYFAGTLGVGAPNPTAKLHVTGDARIEGDLTVTGMVNGTVIVPSDRRLKTDIGPIEGALARILRLEGVRYRYRTEDFPERLSDTGPQYGVIAQDLEGVYPELVRTDRNGYKAVNYIGLIAPLIEATREVATSCADARERLHVLERENAEMKERLRRIEERLGAK